MSLVQIERTKLTATWLKCIATANEWSHHSKLSILEDALRNAAINKQLITSCWHEPAICQRGHHEEPNPSDRVRSLCRPGGERQSRCSSEHAKRGHLDLGLACRERQHR